MKPENLPGTSDERVFVGLGSNLGGREGFMERALAFMSGHPQMELVASTSVIETEPWGGSPGPSYLNAVAEIRTALSPLGLLDACKQFEKECGREDTGRWGPRPIDLDILLFGSRLVSSERLHVPHIQIIHRDFVLRHLLELDPNLSEPGTGKLYKTYI